MSSLIGRKLGMTQKFAEDGSVIALTVLKAGPCVVVQRKTSEHDGYDAVPVRAIARRAEKRQGVGDSG